MFEIVEKELEKKSKVVANPTLSGDEPNLEGAEIDGIKYKVGGEVHLYEHKLNIRAYDDLYCIIHPIYLSNNTSITKDNVPNDLIGYNYDSKDNKYNICYTENKRISIENHGSISILSIIDTITKIF